MMGFEMRARKQRKHQRPRGEMEQMQEMLAGAAPAVGRDGGDSGGPGPEGDQYQGGLETAGRDSPGDRQSWLCLAGKCTPGVHTPLQDGHPQDGQKAQGMLLP